MRKLKWKKEYQFQKHKGKLVLNLREKGNMLSGFELADDDFNYGQNAVKFTIFKEDLYYFLFTPNRELITRRVSLPSYVSSDLGINRRECNIEEISIQFLNEKMNRHFDPVTDEIEDIYIKMTMISEGCSLGFEAPRLKIYRKESEDSKNSHIKFLPIFFVWGAIALFHQFFVQVFRRQQIIIDEGHSTQYSVFSPILYAWACLFESAYLGSDERIISIISLNSYLYKCISLYCCFIGSRKLISSAAKWFILSYMYYYLPPVSLLIIFYLPLLDFIRRIMRFDLHLYLGYILPFVLNLTYFTSFDKAPFVRFKDSIFELPVNTGGLGFFIAMFFLMTYAVIPGFVIQDNWERNKKCKRCYVPPHFLKPHDECPICTQTLVLPIENEEDFPSEIIRVSCNHIYHEECLDKWLDIKPFCPLCKRVLVKAQKKWKWLERIFKLIKTE